ncbi:HAD family hydrolase [Pseudoxanthomonas sp. Root630]|uniref:HAD family hydrolase n=1 Tax=Pseudoxanthomonas sp. Root630 TaxID=1736574 RepID=UPI000703404F|nr:HAD family hydrolase [Pseudoxanthomonas sp. Root630]KRA46315.1 haloacid dehalogenase [Pseudoxanthomonas sp. Root630]
MSKPRLQSLWMFALLVFATAASASDPLPSWKEGPSRRAILAFVDATTRPGSPDFVPEARRIATFDNDGTLWAEQPVYFQVFFVMDRIQAMAGDHPEWRDVEPYKSLLARDLKGALASGEKGMVQVMAATHTGMSVDAFAAQVRQWSASARHPATGRLFTDMVYQPMRELLVYLREHGFRTYIVSGGGQEFMRPWAEHAYGIPPAQVIGSYGELEFALQNGVPVLLKQAKIGLVDDHGGKPVAIQRFIGERPIFAFGNSDGDLQMLQWTMAGDGRRFAGIVHHTDGEREWAYDRASKIGTLDKALDAATTGGWTIVDMKAEWSRIYPDP